MYGLSDTVINELCSVFAKYSNIDKVLIFGSRAKGTYTSGSDIDLALVGESITSRQLMDLRLHIDDLGLLYNVDLLDYARYNGTPIGEHIARVGTLFYSRE